MPTSEATVSDREYSPPATSQVALALRNLQHAVTHCREAIFITNAAGIITRVNPAFEKLTRYSSLEAIGKDLSALTAGGPQSEAYRGMWERIFQQRVFSEPLELQLKDGSLRWVEMTITPVLDNRGHLTSLVFNCADATETAATIVRDSESSCESFDRAKEIGPELNNFLMTVLAHAELAFGTIPPDHPIRTRLQGIKNAARRASDLIRLLQCDGESQLNSGNGISGNAPMRNTNSSDQCFTADVSRTGELSANSPSADRSNRAATLLVVEPEELMRDSMAEFLSKSGYQVLPAATFPEAVEKAKAQHTGIDLVITDLMSSQPSAQQLTMELKAFSPQIKFMFIANQPETTSLLRDAPDLNRSFLKKPFSFEALSEKIAGVLTPRPAKTAASAD